MVFVWCDCPSPSTLPIPLSFEDESEGPVEKVDEKGKTGETVITFEGEVTEGIIGNKESKLYKSYSCKVRDSFNNLRV